MKSLKGFMDEICFKENLTKGMGGEEKFTRSENEFAPREEIWKSCSEQISSEESSEHGVVKHWFLLLPFYSFQQKPISLKKWRHFLL